MADPQPHHDLLQRLSAWEQTTLAASRNYAMSPDDVAVLIRTLHAYEGARKDAERDNAVPDQEGRRDMRTKRVMIEVSYTVSGQMNWAVLTPDTRKSGAHRAKKWRQRGCGMCRVDDALSHCGPLSSVLGALRPDELVPDPKPLDPNKLAAIIAMTQELYG